MADITKCQDHNCHNKDNCYRYTAPTSSYQSFFMRSPRESDGCDYFVQNNQSKVSDKEISGFWGVDRPLAPPKAGKK